MEKLNKIFGVFGVIVKYSAFVVAIIKGLEVMNEEIKKIDLSNDVQPKKVKENDSEGN